MFLTLNLFFIKRLLYPYNCKLHLMFAKGKALFTRISMPFSSKAFMIQQGFDYIQPKI